MRNIDKIIVHHSAVDQPDLDKALRSFNTSHRERFNRKKGYAGTEYIQYHFVIGVDGKIKKTCPLKEVLYHASNFAVNQSSIAVCLVGDFDKHPPTAKQYGSLIKLLREYNLPVHYHNEYAHKTCPGSEFNEMFVNFMVERHNYFDFTLSKRKVKRQDIDKYEEYKQTKNDCTRYNMLGLLSDTIGRRLSDGEIDNFKRWSDMFTDIGSGSNGIIQADILLKRWNFNHPDVKIRAYIASPWLSSKLAGRFLIKGYSAAYSRKTSKGFVMDKKDGYIDNNIVEASGWHATRARFDKVSGYVEEINNYEGSKNNRFKYKDFIEFAKNDNLRDYLMFFYKSK